MSARHKALGRVFGYPECCIKQFSDDLDADRVAGQLRGSINLGERSEEDKARLRPQIEALGLPGSYLDEAPDKLYVPCDKCRAASS